MRKFPYQEIKSVDLISLTKKIVTLENEFKTNCVIIATGAKNRKLHVPGEEALIGRGISFCAICDGHFYKGKKVAVVGGGNASLEESLYLASLANKVTIVIRRDEFRAEASVVDKVKANEKNG